MMHHVYTAIGRTLFLILRPLLRLYFNSRPSRRVRIMVVDSQNRILLIKGWFAHQLWELPGGGIARGEADIAAAIRELHEETGLLVTEQQLVPLGDVLHTETATPYTVVLFYCKVATMPQEIPKNRRWEIVSLRQFPRNSLPIDVHNFVPKALRRATEVE